MNNVFAGLTWEPIVVDIWDVRPTRKVVGKYPDRMDKDSRYLSLGDPYELEGALSLAPRRAAVAAAIQDTKVAYEQLGSLADSSLLLRRSVRITRFVPDRVPAIYTCDRDTRSRFGLPSQDAEAPATTPLSEDCAPLRKMVASLRRRGWKGAIIAPGVLPGTFTVLVPLKFLREKRLSVAYTARRLVPAEVVEHTLGIRFLADGYEWDIKENRSAGSGLEPSH